MDERTPTHAAEDAEGDSFQDGNARRIRRRHVSSLLRGRKYSEELETFADQLSFLIGRTETIHQRCHGEPVIDNRTLSRWLAGGTVPRNGTFDTFLKRFSVVYPETSVPDSLVQAYRKVLESERSPSIDIRHSQPEEDRHDKQIIDNQTVEQIPAAFRFGIQNDKIDALPENLETLDRAIQGARAPAVYPGA